MYASSLRCFSSYLNFPHCIFIIMIFYIYLYITSRIICLCKRRIFGAFILQNSNTTKKYKKIEKRLKKGVDKGRGIWYYNRALWKADNRTAKNEDRKGMKNAAGADIGSRKVFRKNRKKRLTKCCRCGNIKFRRGASPQGAWTLKIKQRSKEPWDFFGSFKEKRPGEFSDSEHWRMLWTRV